jgi:hypothetical protein
VYGFLTTYGLAAVALPFYLKREQTLSPGTFGMAVAAAVAIVLAIAGTLYPVPVDRPYNWLPYLYVGYLLLGMGWQAFATRKNLSTESTEA